MPLTIDWYPDYWAAEERKVLFDFWRTRYYKTEVYLSPSKKPAGGVGFFDADLKNEEFKTSRTVADESHPVIRAYQERRMALLDEFGLSQEEDKFRIQLLLQAEEKSLLWWKIKTLYQPRENDIPYAIPIMKEKIHRAEAIYKDALGQLIEYDREHGHPLADPDRDIIDHPVTNFEYRRWLTRKGRSLLEKSPDDVILKIMWDSNKDNAKSHTLPKPKFNFIPTTLDVWHLRFLDKDKKAKIQRTRTGVVINKKNLKTLVKEKPALPIILSRMGQLADKVNSFKEQNVDTRPENESISLDIDQFMDIGITPPPEFNPYEEIPDHMFEGLRTDEEFEKTFSDKISNEEKQNILNKINRSEGNEKVDNLLAISNLIEEAQNINNNSPLKARITSLKSVQIYKEPDDMSVVEEKEDVLLTIALENSDDFDDNVTEDSSSGDSEIPEWIKNRSIDGYEVRQEPYTLKEKPFAKLISFAEKIKNNVKAKMENIERPVSIHKDKDFWNVAEKTVKNFKGKAISLWKRKVAPSLGLETPERRAISRIKTQELKYLQRELQKMELRKEIEMEMKGIAPQKPKPFRI